MDMFKKNILDLTYNKYLQYLNTCVIIIFTYLIAVAVVIITKQVDYTSFEDFRVLGIISLLFFIISFAMLMIFRDKLKDILQEINNLENK